MKSLALIVTAIVGIAVALPAAAQFKKPEDAIEYRASAFTVMDVHFDRIGEMANGKVPFDAAAVAANADIVAVMSKLPFSAFPEGTAGTRKGTAKANIWTERAKFDDTAKKMQDEVVKLVAASKSGNGAQVKTAFDATRESCKACHQNFRNR
jgi:cytochrome c556